MTARTNTSDAAAREERIRQLEAESAERLAGWQRALADYQNLKRESEDRLQQMASGVRVLVLREILPVYEQLRQATAVRPDASHTAAWVDGIVRIKEQLDNLLVKWRVQPVPSVGTAFNPEVHEAIQSDGGSDVVVRELQAGYTVDGQLLYPSKVVVGSAVDSNKPPESPVN